MTRTNRGTRRAALFAAAVISALLTAAPAHATEPMTYLQIIGGPRHSNPEGVATDATGNVYVTDTVVTTNSTNDRVVKYDANGVLLDVLAGPGTGTGQVFDPTDVAVAPSGDVYVVEKGNARVQRFDDTGTLVGTWGSYGPGNGQFRGPEAIAVDSLGDVYVADTTNAWIQKFDAAGGWTTSWAVTGATGISVDSADVLYVTGGNKVRRFDTSGTLLSEWNAAGSTDVSVDAADNVWVTFTSDLITRYDSTGAVLATAGSQGSGDGQFSNPQGIAVAPDGKLFVADTGNARVQRLSSAAVFQTSWGAYPAPGVMDYPTGMAIDTAGNVFVTNKGQDQIQKFDADGNLLLEWGDLGSSAGQFRNPAALTLDAGGNLFVADTENQRIQVFTGAGVFVRQWGSSGTGNGQVANPAGIAVDGAGNVYVADTDNDRIQKFSSTGTYLTQWGGYGTGNGQFKKPKGIAIDGSGNVWVADAGNHRIQQFTGAGAFVSKWGTSGGADGQLSSPSDLDFDAFGTLWVADKGHDRIQRFTSAGIYLSKLGSVGLDIGQFDTPSAVGIDPSGRLVVADTYNHRVQVFVDANGPDTTILTGPALVSASTSATFTFSANEPGATFECKIDAGVYGACSTPKGYSSLTEGAHTFSVRAIDILANTGNPSVYTWSIDITSPTVVITGSPTSPTASTTPSFTFTASEPGSTFRCVIDGGTPVTCTSPYTTTVTSGSHTFGVWAIDPAGNTGPTSSASWTVDKTPPSVSITSGPTGWTASTDATVAFDSPEPSATFQCRFDGGVYAGCTSSVTYSSLPPGSHTFSVRAIDTLGNISAPVSRSWTVDASIHKPDALISTSTTYVGNGVYNATGSSQTKTLKGKAGTVLVFKVRIENDGADADPITVLGAGSASGYQVTYFYGATDVTAKVKAGTYTLKLSPGQAKVVTMKVKIGAKASASKSFLVKATSGHDPTKLDAVKAIAKKT